MRRKRVAEKVVLGVGEQVLGGSCSGPWTVGAAEWEGAQEPHRETRAPLPARPSAHCRRVAPTPSLSSDPTGEDLVPKPAGKGAQSEQEAAAAAASTATPSSPRCHPLSSWATPGGPVPQLRQPPGRLLPSACQRGVSGLVPTSCVGWKLVPLGPRRRASRPCHLLGHHGQPPTEPLVPRPSVHELLPEDLFQLPCSRPQSPGPGGAPPPAPPTTGCRLPTRDRPTEDGGLVAGDLRRGDPPEGGR